MMKATIKKTDFLSGRLRTKVWHLGLLGLLLTSLPPGLGIRGAQEARWRRRGAGAEHLGQPLSGCLHVLHLRGGRQAKVSGNGDEVSSFLARAGLEAHAEAFAREKVQMHNLGELGEDDLEELGLLPAEVQSFSALVSQEAKPMAKRVDPPLPEEADASAKVKGKGEDKVKDKNKGSMQNDANETKARMGKGKVDGVGTLSHEEVGDADGRGGVGGGERVGAGARTTTTNAAAAAGTNGSGGSSSSLSGKETTRLETLLALLSSGTTSLSRLTAAEQLAKLYLSHDQLRTGLVARCVPLLKSSSWETRSAAGHALDEMARVQAKDQTPQTLPGVLISCGAGESELARLSLEEDMQEGPFLLASESVEYAVEAGKKGGRAKGKIMAGKRARQEEEEEEEVERERSCGSKKKQEGSVQGDVGGVKGEKLVLSYQGNKEDRGQSSSFREDDGDDENVWPFSRALHSMLADLSNPRWEHRHGAALGVRNILRRQRGLEGTDRQVGEWPSIVRGVVVQLLKVLARDRFSDFSGDLVVSPVREAVAQALGEASTFLDQASVASVLKALRSLQAYQGEWEVRQSSLLGLKYLLAACSPGCLAPRMELAVEMIMGGIGDVDDVRSAAAEAAIPLVPRPQAVAAGSPEKVVDASAWTQLWASGELERVLWESLEECDELSASTAPVLGLLARLLETGVSTAQPDAAARSEQLKSTWVFMRHKLTSVRVATTLIMGQLVRSWGAAGCPDVLHGDVLVKTLQVTYLSLLLEDRDHVGESLQALWTLIIDACDREDLGSASAHLWGNMVRAASFDSAHQLDLSTVCSIPEVLQGLASTSKASEMDGASRKKKTSGGRGAAKKAEEQLKQPTEGGLVDGLGLGRAEVGGSEAKLTAIKALSHLACRCSTEGLDAAHAQLQGVMASGNQGEQLAASLLLLEWATSMETSSGVHNLDWPDAAWTHLSGLMSPSLPPDSPIPASLAGIYAISGASLPAALSLENIFTDCLKFEVDAVLQRRAAESLAAALRLGRCGVKELRELSAMISSDRTFLPYSSNFTGPASVSFSWITWKPSSDGSTIRDGTIDRIGKRGAEMAISAICKQCTGRVFEVLPGLWDECEAQGESAEDEIKSLCFSMVLLSNMEAGDEREMLISNMLPRTLKALRSDESALRQIAARGMAEICLASPLKGMTAIIRSVIPVLGDVSDDWARLGACEMLHRVTVGLGHDVLPYAVFFVVPILGGMSDSIPSIRETSTQCFGTLLKILPLEEGVPDPIGLDADLMSSKLTERSFLEQLLDTSKVEEFRIPVKIMAELRKYQSDGVNWLGFLFKYHLHGILCDDMGLGKTLQTIAGMASEIFYRRQRYKEDRQQKDKALPSLIVCPSTLVNHWLFEIKKFCPNGLEADAYTGKDAKHRSLLRQRLRASDDIIVMSYESLRNDVCDLIESHPAWNFVILDEGHIIKNAKSKITLAVKSVGNCANHRLILTGTPIQNNVLELWSLFDFLMPGFLGDESHFNTAYSRPILASGKDLRVNQDALKTKGGNSLSTGSAMALSSRDAAIIEAGEQALEKLHRQVLPFMLRRTKAEVLHDLPPKIIQDIVCPMSPIQQKLYDEFARSQARHLEARRSGQSGGTEADSGKGTFAALQHLKKLANHPLMAFSPGDKEHSEILKMQADDGLSADDITLAPKLVALKNLLLECGIGQQQGEGSATSSGHRALIFLQMKTFVDIVENDLFKKVMPTVSYLRMDGSTPVNQRFEMQQKFNSDPTIDVLLLTTRVGGLGLTLTGADTVIFLEHDWNPMKDMQAMDRSHRIGQKRVVNVYRIISQGSIEESIMGMQRFKQNVADSVVNEDNNSLQGMDTSNLLDLFAPSTSKVLAEADRVDGDGQDASQVADKIGGGGRYNKVLGAVGELWNEDEYDDLGVEAFMGQRSDT